VISADSRPAPDKNLPGLSIIVPVYNEAESIEAFLVSVRNSCAVRTQIIVVDGGSTDATATLARPLCDELVPSRKERAAQMNAGARHADATTLWFLHADTRVPEHVDELILDALAGSGRCWGFFNVRLSGNHLMLRIVEHLMNLRSRLTGVATGDRGIFVKRELFDGIGGFPGIALMEDIAISRKLNAAGRPVCLSQKLVTSSRRWEKNGVLRTILLMWKLRLLYFLGVHPDRLVQMYYGRGN
jgi:rSAM/selenodomain-associated transferase 2